MTIPNTLLNNVPVLCKDKSIAKAVWSKMENQAADFYMLTEYEDRHFW